MKILIFLTLISYGLCSDDKSAVKISAVEPKRPESGDYLALRTTLVQEIPNSVDKDATKATPDDSNLTDVSKVSSSTIEREIPTDSSSFVGPTWNDSENKLSAIELKSFENSTYDLSSANVTETVSGSGFDNDAHLYLDYVARNRFVVKEVKSIRSNGSEIGFESTTDTSSDENGTGSIRADDSSVDTATEVTPNETRPLLETTTTTTEESTEDGFVVVGTSKIPSEIVDDNPTEFETEVPLWRSSFVPPSEDKNGSSSEEVIPEKTSDEQFLSSTDSSGIEEDIESGLLETTTTIPTSPLDGDDVPEKLSSSTVDGTEAIEESVTVENGTEMTTGHPEPTSGSMTSSSLPSETTSTSNALQTTTEAVFLDSETSPKNVVAADSTDTNASGSMSSPSRSYAVETVATEPISVTLPVAPPTVEEADATVPSTTEPNESIRVETAAPAHVAPSAMSDDESVSDPTTRSSVEELSRSVNTSSSRPRMAKMLDDRNVDSDGIDSNELPERVVVTTTTTETVPRSTTADFSCDDKTNGGYYADVASGCRFFHICVFFELYNFGTKSLESRPTNYVMQCPVDTAYSQRRRVCDFDSIVRHECPDSEKYYSGEQIIYEDTATDSSSSSI